MICGWTSRIGHHGTLIVAQSHKNGDVCHLTVFEANNFSMKAAIEAQAVLRLVSRVFGRTHR